MRGRVSSVNVSSGGLPKLPVGSAWVGTVGLDADGHELPSHGGKRAAVCLYAVEAIARVAADGHEAFPVRTARTSRSRGSSGAGSPRAIG
jgi:hypothetical protein